ncbi:MAG TPA: hypothetical protein DCM64_02780 [Gammaproteobacteria bacterium]|jgi:hypothetical protein|nr:hypothetical protein [Gammaproteobacteria bacterium]MDP6733086.1 hypothetical protein [Gammaproteobacteria bacterium]HAJ75359.1 hypothetical protein [Gammaproteobacteria bacterium]
MSNEADKIKARRRFLTGMGVVATTATLATSAQAQQSSSGRRGFTPARHEEDSWMDAIPGSHRVFVDSSTKPGGVTAMNYANNLMVGHTTGYAGEESDNAIIVCFRHASTALGFNDAMWKKYSGSFNRGLGFNDPNTDGPFETNPLHMEVSRFVNRGNTIQSLIERGISYCICNKATQSLSAGLARGFDGSADEIYQELIQNNIDGSRFVATGVTAATRNQEYGYSLLYAG